jgi:peptide/nickel transport system permease protein
MSATTAAARPTTISGRHRTWRDLPVVHQLRQSVGVQRGMLVVGLVLTGVFVLVALLAPLIAPYRWAQREADGQAFDTLQPPGGDHLLGTTQGGYDVLSRTLWGAQTALATMVLAVVLSIFVGIALGLVSGYLGGWLDRVLVVVADAPAGSWRRPSPSRWSSSRSTCG